MQFLEFLKGKKSYFVAVGIAAVVLLHGFGILTQESYLTLLGLLNAGGVAALRAGFNGK